MNYFRMDTHAHIDLYKDRKSTIDKIEREKSYTIVVTNLPVLFAKYYDQYKGLKYVKFAIGLHPELAHKYKKQLTDFMKHLSKTRYIGEIGLDYTVKDLEDRNVQLSVFKAIVDECNYVGKKILTVHSRKAEKDVNQILKNFNGKVIMHWYTGGGKELENAIANDCYFSINHHMIKSKNGKKIIEAIPMNRILLESDAPFTNKLSESYSTSFMLDIYKYLSDLYCMDMEKVSKRLKENFRQLVEV